MAKFSLIELARKIDAQVVGDASVTVGAAASLRDAGPDEISFCAEERYLPELAQTKAGAVVLSKRFGRPALACPLLVCEDAGRAFAVIAPLLSCSPQAPRPGVHATAQIGAGARLAEDVSVGPWCVIGDGSELGRGVVLHAAVVIGADCKIGAESELFPHVTMYDGVSLGARCRIHAGAVIGSDGFGYQPPSARGGAWTKIPQTGRVVIEDDVEIGANAAIDRARFGTTRIGQGCKLDNMVHIAHNVVLGPRCMIAAQVGIAGSARVGSDCMIGGQAGLGGHLEVGAGTQIAGGSGVWASLDAGSDVMGYPARPRRQALKQYAQMARLERLEARLKRLEPSEKAPQQTGGGA